MRLLSYCGQFSRVFTLAATAAALACIISCSPPPAPPSPEPAASAKEPPKPGTAPAKADEKSAAKQDNATTWPTFFGSPSRNPVNTTEKNIATEWSATDDEKKNIKWVVELGSRSYGGPVFEGGRIF